MWTISLALFIAIFCLWITWRRRKLRFFQELNIPGPPPNPLFGNLLEIFHEVLLTSFSSQCGKEWFTCMTPSAGVDGFGSEMSQLTSYANGSFEYHPQEGQHICIERWIEKYGKVFGYYLGLRPVLIVADLDALRQIQQKEFQKFSTRPGLFEVGSSSTSFNNQAITTVNGKKWKQLRSILTPTFTTSKLKKMNPIINESINELVEAAENESAGGKPFDIYRLYQNLTMDVIARTTLGIHSNAQKEEDDPFVRLARLVMAFKKSYIVVFTFSFIEIMPVFSWIRYLKGSFQNKGRFPREELLEKTAAAISVRRSNPEYRRPDLLQLMMDAKTTDENVNESNLTAGENDDSVSNEVQKEIPSKSGKGLTDDEIVQNAGIFLLAGYETTSTALAFLTHVLAYHQDVQDKVREEINQNISDNDEISYEVVNKLPYLDNVFNETLRIYPPITHFVNRQCLEDTIIGKYKIPKNIAIQVPVYNLHHDPTVWENPEEFNPDRFLPENKNKRHPMAFQPFGAGPRNCIGMRFAQMEAKMAIATLLKKYRILPKSGTKEEDFEVLHTLVTYRPENGVVVQLESI